MHHCIADGIALARLMLSLTDSPPADDDDGWLPVVSDGDGGGRPTRRSAALVHEGLEALRHPRASSISPSS